MTGFPMWYPAGPIGTSSHVAVAIMRSALLAPVRVTSNVSRPQIPGIAVFPGVLDRQGKPSALTLSREPAEIGMTGLHCCRPITPDRPPWGLADAHVSTPSGHGPTLPGKSRFPSGLPAWRLGSEFRTPLSHIESGRSASQPGMARHGDESMTEEPFDSFFG
ncbi:hypothetical protein UVI_02012260 [Ustilaginoidea virens]|uniref:Uncharacterized protein n=1 Tax=Ustilaginoidea virens TaxID=1159556 RepID=A0A1B5L4X9_USTVR|nr:hypothetical protein UVI_02012260 [Ustilaginoidea virens]